MSQSAQYDITPIRQDAGLHVWEHRADSPRLVVSFSGIGLKDAKAPPYEFSKMGYDHIVKVCGEAGLEIDFGTNQRQTVNS